MMTDIRARAIALYDAFTHEHHDRRAFMAQMVALAGSAVAAEALVASIAASPAAAQQVPAQDPRLVVDTIRSTVAERPMTSYVAALRDKPGPRPIVLVIHENRGLNDHIRDVARRVALAGFWAIAPDLLAPQGGTPADEDQARTMIGTVDYDLALRQAIAMLGGARGNAEWNGRAGAIGFCWGGAFVNRLAVAAGEALTAGVSYYGPAPAPAEVAKVRAQLLVHLAGNDERVNATGVPWGDALKAAGRGEAVLYPGVDHAFNNDTSAARYDKAAADLAWQRTTAFLHRHLDA